MLDEPLTSLDEDLKQRGLALFRQVRDEFKTPLIYVSHTASELAELCQEAVEMKGGRVTRIASARPVGPQHIRSAIPGIT